MDIKINVRTILALKCTFLQGVHNFNCNKLFFGERQAFAIINICIIGRMQICTFNTQLYQLNRTGAYVLYIGHIRL